MKYIPLLFSTLMVQAVFSNRKTVTRRIKGLSRINEDPDNWELYMFHHVKDCLHAMFSCNRTGEKISIKCPYGDPGDLLWVRETTRKYYGKDENGDVNSEKLITEYAADNPEPIYLEDGDGFGRVNKDGSEKMIPWKPSIFMPKAACRHFLEVTDVTIERLQDISQEDAKAEGVFPAPHRCPGWKNPLLGFKDCYKCAFQLLWNSINGPIGHPWDKNEWVWVVSFKRIEKPVTWPVN